MTFGEFIKSKRQKLGLTLRSFADGLNIAPSYLSDIEKGKRNAPTQDILNKMCSLLKLDSKSKEEFFDLAANSKNEIAQDITVYVNENQNVRVALRRAKELNFGDEEWLKIIEQLISKK